MPREKSLSPVPRAMPATKSLLGREKPLDRLPGIIAGRKRSFPVVTATNLFSYVLCCHPDWTASNNSTGPIDYSPHPRTVVVPDFFSSRNERKLASVVGAMHVRFFSLGGHLPGPEMTPNTRMLPLGV